MSVSRNQSTTTSIKIREPRFEATVIIRDGRATLEKANCVAENSNDVPPPRWSLIRSGMSIDDLKDVVAFLQKVISEAFSEADNRPH